MKKVLFALLGGLFFSIGAQAQEDGVKLAKSAGKALTAYNQDPSGNSAKLAEAITKIDQALNTAEAQALASAWLTKGDAYSTRYLNEMSLKQINPNAKLSGENDALEAYRAFKKAYDMPQAKKYEKTEALTGLSSMQSHLINLGVIKYNEKDYDGAFHSFEASLEAHEVLVANKKKSALDDPKDYTEQVFFTGFIASLAKRCPDAVKYYEQLYAKGTDNVAVYEGLYVCKTEMGDEAAALKFLSEGRKKFPNESSLLFAEINYYLSKGRLDELTGRLEEAISKEPDNVSLYRTLGDVYNNLFTTLLEDSTQTKEQKAPKLKELADKAKANFLTAVNKEPNNADVNYSLGALLYNETNLIAQEMNATSYSTAAGQKRYAELKKEMLAGVEEALKYFQKAESLEPNDPNTLAALVQAYGRKEDDELYMVFKKRLDMLKKGEKHSAPYFKQ
jgi:hypothetical protein